MSGPLNTHVVCGDQALTAFRDGLTGPFAFEQLAKSGGRLLVQLPVGVGKSAWMVKIIDHALNTACEHDLVVVLVPRRDVLRELQARLPKGMDPVVLIPRPRQRCAGLDPSWSVYEKSGCGLLGRQELCRQCSHRKGCRWPGQYGERLKGVRLILATQQHLVLNPLFVEQLRQSTDAKRVLLLLDESDLLLKSSERLVRPEELQRFISAQESALARMKSPHPREKQFLEFSRIMAEASTKDLRGGNWSFPRFNGTWALQVQDEGRRIHGDAFRFLGFDLRCFRRSDVVSRERTEDGTLRFAIPPDLGDEFIIFSGSMAKELARYRLDPNHRDAPLDSPFERHEFRHPATKWFNIGSSEGAACYFVKNAARILHFFAGKIASNIKAGKRTLLVCRKKFREICRKGLAEQLRLFGVNEFEILTDHWDSANLENPRTLPLITYGICGLNRFEWHDAAYCLTSYYVNEKVVSSTVYDIDAISNRYPITIESEGTPKQRRACVAMPDDRELILPLVAQGVLVQKEADVVLQAVGRVRPFTRSREVITFQQDTLPGVNYSLAFASLSAARSYFQLPTRRECEREDLLGRIRRLRNKGMTQVEVGQTLEISLSTVKRYERRARGQNCFT